MKATNRQKKVLRFFGLTYSPNISLGAAGWEIGNIFHSGGDKERWNRYLLATGDFDGESDELSNFTEEMLNSVEIPDGLTAYDVVSRQRKEFVEEQMSDGSPFDSPAPEIQVPGKSFLFTGRFELGSRAACQKAVVERGGIAPSVKSVGPEIDYLVIGEKGSSHWSHGSYGNKIESAILKRRELGNLAIVSEAHWKDSLGLG